jgi:plastocyanin
VDSGNVDGGRSGTVTVTADVSGVYEFVCVYHERSAMVGRLVLP